MTWIVPCSIIKRGLEFILPISKLNGPKVVDHEFELYLQGRPNLPKAKKQLIGSARFMTETDIDGKGVNKKNEGRCSKIETLKRRNP
jgi:hypothetical protein